MKAQPHPQQHNRLTTLRQFDILDTPRERDFDDIVALASEICGTPIAVINLIDEHRQWFKAEVGLGVRETPLATSICSHVILEEDFVEIEDTLIDKRTADNELCLAPDNGLRFYAGALLRAENGLPIGTFCVLDTKPNKLTDMQRRVLSILARRVMRELELRVALKSQDALRNEMDHRVKNSLQTISSNLNVQERLGKRTGDWPAAFSAVRRQIDAVSAVHRELHRSKGSETLNLSDYLQTLTGHLAQSIPAGISLEVDAASIMIPPKIATSLGVVINEFVANAMKHAFHNQQSGEITVSATHDGRQLNLICHNDAGEDVAPAPKETTGLGQRLLKAAIAQHGGIVDQGPDSTGGYTLDAKIPFRIAST